MIKPRKFIDIQDNKKDKNYIKTEVHEDFKKDFKKYLEEKKIKIKLEINFKKLDN